MKLLFDANLSPKLVDLLRDQYPDSKHVLEIGLTLPDVDILAFALAQDYIVVTKDDDFEGLAFLGGPPRKVILIRLGNCRTEAVALLLRTEFELVSQLAESTTEVLLAIP
ncbi:MAG: DUF5615 family PIN-like protein [Fimbriimonadaceae bacterium]|nr:DUF5615 family PIN-like protein [Fimbriimonadaceae bacterium]